MSIDIVDDNLNRNDRASFQNIFCDLTDDIIEEYDDWIKYNNY